ncbi:hypothetical protein BHE74_00009006 [Ensete ventricosum]|nr:hypothetical protein BHE74_00009006 [Ensete ventricosum]RZR81520.1 hypothetical protein BHM03_00007765 [Ensete ventricosum]
MFIFGCRSPWDSALYKQFKSPASTAILVVFSADSLSVESLLELLDEENLRKHTAIPSPEWSSDHIALLAEFRCKPRIRR